MPTFARREHGALQLKTKIKAIIRPISLSFCTKTTSVHHRIEYKYQLLRQFWEQTFLERFYSIRKKEKRASLAFNSIQKFSIRPSMLLDWRSQEQRCAASNLNFKKNYENLRDDVTSAHVSFNKHFPFYTNHLRLLLIQ